MPDSWRVAYQRSWLGAALSSLFGVLILAFASLLWFVLQLRWRLLVADEVEDAI
ncbi:MAG: hypothetical protein IIB37_01245 [Gemmatimonadetes bacterium]|nr:hypothetical protein [Gemmatimonadota bacterium]MCH8812014.1 hypothetical protein [Gemmatimonadota bacterium]